ncbi:ABC transporter ATP-binding protein [Pseudonocardiaceae bacterium YIM PH 21723]|nr:ABC transporter ATP-binding protein [Pseudonocardiaceae bacterium YIM PH 21723]
MTAAAVVLHRITKAYPGVVANNEVSLKVERGEVHALCGENGAGKSTLMKILYGMVQPDSGEIEVGGSPVDFRTPADAIRAGIGMVHQHFMLADNLTVLENVVLGAEDIAGIGRAARGRLQQLITETGLTVEPTLLAAELGVAERQRVEILKVLYRGAKIIILDEPTAVLVPQEVEELFATIEDMRDSGYTFVFISHKLDEVRAIADRITVLRRGKVVGSVATDKVTNAELAEAMVGSELPSPTLRGGEPGERVVLQLEALSLRSPGDDGTGVPLLDGISLRIRSGEIVGIAGVEGNGQTELVETIMGMRQSTAGRLILGGHDMSGATTRELREAGIGFVPEDRIRHGLLPEQPLWMNRLLGHQTDEALAGGQWLDIDAIKRDTEQLVRDYDVRTPDIEVLAGALSGGNQQKLIIGRELAGEPQLLVAAHPTRGVDVGAQAFLWEQIRQARDAGLGVLLVSADLDELIGLSDTIKVMFCGRILAEADPSTVTPEELGVAMTGAILAASTEDDSTDHLAHAHRYADARGGNRRGGQR